MSDEQKPKQFFNRRPSLDRLWGVGTPVSGRYFESYAEQVMINQHLHAQDYVSIKRTMKWAIDKGYIK